MSEDTKVSVKPFCCLDMLKARSYDGPFYSYKLAGPAVFGVTVYKLTQTRKSISNAVGSWQNMPIHYCPFCGKDLNKFNGKDNDREGTETPA